MLSSSENDPTSQATSTINDRTCKRFHSRIPLRRKESNFIRKLASDYVLTGNKPFSKHSSNAFVILDNLPCICIILLGLLEETRSI